MLKKLFLFFIVSQLSFALRAQTTLTAGDILFTGFNAVSTAGTAPDTFAFVVLTPITSSTVIYFTDRGYQGGVAWQGFGGTEGTISWNVGSALAIGDEVEIYGFNARVNSVANGTVAQVAGGNAITGLSLGNTGDGLVAFQNGAGDPTNVASTMIAGISWQLNCGTTSDASWNGSGCTYGPQSSLIPNGLTNGTSAMLAGVAGSSPGYNSHGKFQCTGTPYSTVAALRTAVLNKANWIFDVSTTTSAFNIPAGCNYYATCVNPTISTQPSNRNICNGANTSFTIAATGATAYQWQLNSGSGFANITNGGIYSNATTSTLNITGATSGMNGYLYRCIASDGACSTTSSQATLTVSTINTASASQTNVSCNGGSNGAASVSPTGGVGAYTYSWSPSGGTGSIASGLTAGSYTVTVTDAISCTGTRNYTITQPPVLNGSTVVTNVACNGGTNGAINLTPSGGTPGYTFSWTAGPTTEDRTGLAAGTYSVTITDANACTRNVTGITVTQPTSAVSGTTVVTNVACNSGTNGAINLTPTGGTGPYTFNWVSGPTTEDRTGLPAGTYSVTITDANACTGTVSGITVTQPTAVSGTTVVTNVACFGGSTGAINLTPTGGVGPYTFNWASGPTTEDRTGLAAGTYSVTITDANACTGTVSGITVTQPTAVSGTTVVTNVACFGGSTGAINLTPTGGVGPYTFLWSTGQITPNRSSVVAGTYSVTITDAVGCTANASATITQPTAITASISSTASSCSSSSGTATVSAVSGGAGGYTYNWSPGTPTGDGTTSITGLSAGTWTCTITDANGCVLIQNRIVAGAAAPSLTAASQTNVSCFGGSNGAASVNAATGGAGGYTYNWTPGNPTGDGTTNVTGLTAGTWTCTVTDAGGCTAAQNFTITQPTAPVSGTTVVTNVACFGGNTGAINLTPTGGVGPYTFNWAAGPTTEDRTSLTAGTYSVTITDANGCTGTVSGITVTQPTAAISGTTVVTNVACFGGNTGAINLTPTGGVGPYTFNWAAGPTTEDRTSLTAGTYSVTITDANGCTGTVNATVTQPASTISGTTVVTNVACNGGATGAINLTPTGGVGPYTFNWASGPTTEDRTLLAAGTYSVTITDANGCTGTANATVTQPTAIVLSAASQTNVSCFGGSNGAAAVNAATGGAGGYTYNWTPGTPTGDGTVSVTGLTAGTWTCTVTDVNGCTAAQNFTVTQPTAIVLTAASQTNVACNGGTNGAAAVNAATGGAGGYTYDWTPGTPSGDGTFSVTGLTAGTWTCTVTDANGCTSTQNFTVTQPTPLVLTAATQTNVSCFGGSNGAASVNAATGGAGSYTYNWTPGNPTGDGSISVTGLSAQTYTCTVTDANGCTTAQNFTITQPTAIVVASSTQTNVSCFGGSNGTASISTPTGGAGAFTYNWTPGNPSGDGTTAVTGLTAGTWTCTITDANGCTNTQNVTITQPTALLLSAAAQTNVSCFGENDGAASVNAATGGVGTYAYDWSPGTPIGEGTTSVTGLTAGTWTCTVSDLNGCTTNQVFNITQPAAIASSLTITDCDSYTFNAQTYTVSGTYTQLFTSVSGCDSTVTLNLTINNSNTSTLNMTACSSYTLNTQTYTTSGTYVQNLTNVAGCDSTLTLNLIINQPSASSITQASCYGYTLNGQTYTASGTYTQTLTNAVGCDSTITLNLTIFNATSSNVTVTACDSYTLGNQVYTTSGVYVDTISNVGGCDSIVTLNLTINQSTASSFTAAACEFYNWNGTSYNASGVYTQTFTNAVGCDSVVTLNLTINLPYENTTEVTACDAYVWNGQTYTTSGIYTVTNPNMNGCDSTEHLDLTIVTSPTASITVLDPIILQATGTGTYQWIDCATGQALPGETDQNFVATYNSSYAVIVSNGNCSDTSNCAVINTIGLDENNGLTAIQMVPNPASEEVIITWTSLDENANITIYDAQGKLVQTTPNFKSGQALNVAPFETGMYIVVIKTTSSQSIERLIKQ